MFDDEAPIVHRAGRQVFVHVAVHAGHVVGVDIGPPLFEAGRIGRLLVMPEQLARARRQYQLAGVELPFPDALTGALQCQAGHAFGAGQLQARTPQRQRLAAQAPDGDGRCQQDDCAQDRQAVAQQRMHHARLVQEAVEAEVGGQHALLAVRAGDGLPAFGIAVAQLHQVLLQQRHHLRGFMHQLFAAVALGVARADQVGHLGRVGHGVMPAAQGGLAQRFGARRVLAQFALGGIEHVAIEIEAGAARRAHFERHLAAFEREQRLGGVERYGVHPASQEIVEIVGVRQLDHAVVAHPGLFQVGGQFLVVGRHHDAAAGPGARFAIGTVAYQQRGGGMLEHRGQHHHRLTERARQQQRGIAHAVLGAALGHRLHRVAARRRFEQRYVEAGIAIIALVLGRVIAGELELVLPLELDRDFFGRARVGSVQHPCRAGCHEHACGPPMRHLAPRWQSDADARAEQGWPFWGRIILSAGNYISFNGRN
ncbi:hypothetical protein DUPY_14080 [Duganella phyllosphaerae]|uniref:Uncharacterized protein n=1 Tax=Duganella phyllosphaerae TaxID=762836 RepID=A0A1E7X2H1_9BURK|nr:hypothetical protein DUPY_14080 [Duganella phyllosphaerae]